MRIVLLCVMLVASMSVVVGVSVPMGSLQRSLQPPLPARVVADKFKVGPTTAQIPVQSIPAGCPPEMAPIRKDGGSGFSSSVPPQNYYCIDRWEAMLVTVDQTTRTETDYTGDGIPVLPAGSVWKAVSKAGVYPQGYVDRNVANQACANAGKRLCDGDEWLGACTGAPPTGTSQGGWTDKPGTFLGSGEAKPPLKTYPYSPGFTVVKDVCNDMFKSKVVYPPAVLYPKNPYASIQKPGLNRVAGGLAKTGEYAGCKTDTGVWDLFGNLEEWTSQRLRDAKSNNFCVGEERGVFRGGFYAESKANGRGCYYWNRCHSASQNDYSIGFRCCASAPGQP